MKTNRTITTTLVLICIALWGLLLRPLFGPTPAKAQALPAPAATQSPVITAPSPGIPYMVVADGKISLWYVDVPDAKQSRPGETSEEMAQAIMKNTRLVRSDVQSLPNR